MTDTVWIIDNGRAVERDAADLFREYADETTTPHGVDTRYHVRGCELWTWGVGGSFPRLIEAFGSEADAERALADSFRYDFDHDSEAPDIYDTEADALRALAELGDE